MAQDLGHRIPGAVGIDAGTQSAPGLSILYRLLSYEANKSRDRNGNLLPIEGLDLDALANSFGLSLTLKPRRAPYLTASIAAPISRITVNSTNPLVGVDRFGFGDIYVVPIKVGWRWPHADLVTSYAFYAPTGHFSLSGEKGVSSGEWTHQLSLGGAGFWGSARQNRASALASYFISQKKRGIDITRGNILQIQGGAGAVVFSPVTLGVAFYALWQTTDDRGKDLPPALRGARDRVYGLGPEAVATIAAIRTRIDLRYEWDFGVRSRPQGSVFTIGLSFVAWRPHPRDGAGGK